MSKVQILYKQLQLEIQKQRDELAFIKQEIADRVGVVNALAEIEELKQQIKDEIEFLHDHKKEYCL